MSINIMRSRLIERIRRIDPFAADWLIDHQCNGYFPSDGSLEGWFCWSEMPQGHKYWSDINKALQENQKRRDKTMKDKMTEEQAKLYAALLWEELCKPEYYPTQPRQRTKEKAVQNLTEEGLLPYTATCWGYACSYCELYHNDEPPCPGCPYDESLGRCTVKGPYAKWWDDPCPETAQAMADFCWFVYRGQDGGGKEHKACACCKDEKPKAVRFEVGDRVKLLDSASGSSTDPLHRFPKWNNTRVAGAVVKAPEFNGSLFEVRWDNGELSEFSPFFAAHLTPTERLMLAQRPIRPGDMFKYWRADRLHTLVAVDDGYADGDTYFVDLDRGELSRVTSTFDREDLEVDEEDLDEWFVEEQSSLGYDVYFERLVPVGRVKWSVEPKE